MAIGYVIAQITATDPDACPAYVAMVSPTVEAFDGRFFTCGDRAQSDEGTPPGDRDAVIEFPSVQAANDWYHADICADAKAIRQSASTSVQTLVEGIE